LTGITCFPLFSFVFAIDGFRQYPGTGGFAHATGSAKQKSMGQLIVPDGIL
jgi:hypothetical protein